MKIAFTTLLAGACLLGTSQAYVAQLFSDDNCQNPAGERNVYDNTCATLGGFQSFKITTWGGGGQEFYAYSRNACAGPNTVRGCARPNHGRNLGDCIKATNGNGGSNALGSQANVYC